MSVRNLAASVLAAALVVAGGPVPAAEPTPPEQAARIQAGKTTRKDVEQLLGRPGLTYFLRAEQREAWGYRYAGRFEPRIFWVEWSADGTVHSTSDMPDYDAAKYRGG